MLNLSSLLSANVGKCKSNTAMTFPTKAQIGYKKRKFKNYYCRLLFWSFSKYFSVPYGQAVHYQGDLTRNAGAPLPFLRVTITVIIFTNQIK